MGGGSGGMGEDGRGRKGREGMCLVRECGRDVMCWGRNERHSWYCRDSHFHGFLIFGFDVKFPWFVKKTWPN